VIRGGRVQCVYNPEVGREARWGSGTLVPASERKRALVIGAGPAGLEYARVSAARGHEVIVLEREAEVGGHVRKQALLPGRKEYGQIARWLEQQATGNGAEIRLGTEVTEDALDELVVGVDHVVVATGSSYRRDGWQGQTAAPIPGWETGQCVTWDDVATGEASPSGSVVVIDDLQDAPGPLTAVKLAQDGASVKLVTRWPMIGMETIPEVYYLWVRQQLYEAGVKVVPDLFAIQIDGREVTFINVYTPDRMEKLEADWIVMSTGRQSDNALYHALRARGVSVEMVGDAVAPRGTYEAVFEGHRQARKL
jgi:pyruvate/2-oxoglutarate dehydrogenase complex dihydrolipoamide dehydrogenase (E3) component